MGVTNNRPSWHQSPWRDGRNDLNVIEIPRVVLHALVEVVGPVRKNG